MQNSILINVLNDELSGYILAAYAISSIVILSMWVRSNHLLKRAKRSLEALENKP